MEILQIVVAGVIGTVLMTAFSFFISRVTNRQYREPVILNKVVDGWTRMQLTPHQSNPLGWALHFFVGIVFAAAIILIWEFTGIDSSLLSASILGAIAGIIGIGVWFMTFLFAHIPASIDLMGFFTQLLIAHVIFGIGVWLGYDVFE